MPAPFGQLVGSQKNKMKRVQHYYQRQSQRQPSPLKHKLLSVLQQEDENIRSTNKQRIEIPENDPKLKFYPPKNPQTHSQNKLSHLKKINPLHARVKTLLEEKKNDTKNATGFKRYKD